MYQKPKPCVSFALGMGTILSVASSVRVQPLDNSDDHYKWANQAWQNTGNHINNALKKATNATQNTKK